MFSVGILTKLGKVFGECFKTKEEAENYILEFMEKEDLKQARIRNQNTGEEEKVI